MKNRYLSLIAGACFILASGALQAATATFDSFSEGSVGYGRFGSITMSVDSVATSASLDIFAGSTHANNRLTLSAYNQGSFVDSVSVWISAFSDYASGALQYTMTIDGIQFDELRLVSDFGDASFILLDNVVFNTPAPVPVPPAGVLFVSGLMWLGAKRRNKKSLLTA